MWNVFYFVLKKIVYFYGIILKILKLCSCLQETEIPQSVYRIATGRTVRGSNPGVSDIFHTRTNWPWGPPRLLYSGYRAFAGGKAAGSWH